MAAGIVYHDITTSAGETFTVASWVPDTGTPDVGAFPVHIQYDASGVEVWTAAKITTMLGHLDGVETKLDTLHTDLDTTLKGYVDGLEALIALTNGYVDGLETLIGSTNTALAAATPAGSNTIGAVTNPQLTNFGAGEYETVAASQTAQVLGATGGAGDYISGVLVIPASTSPGNVILLDNATSITIFAGGASSVSNLVPFFVPLGMISVSGAWKLTTGANVSCIGIGNFT